MTSKIKVGDRIKCEKPIAQGVDVLPSGAELSSKGLMTQMDGVVRAISGDILLVDADPTMTFQIHSKYVKEIIQ